MRFVGYSLTSKEHRLFDETNRKLYVRRHVEFNESDFAQKSAMTTEPDPKSMELKQNADSTAKDEEEVAETRRPETEEQQELQSSMICRFIRWTLRQLFLAITSRPDIAQAVGVVSTFCANPTQSHLTTAKRILRYLKGSLYLGLTYKKCADANLIGY